MPAPTEILSLIERFDRNRQAFLSGEYNETQLRREFLDPFFAALGWDLDNRQGFAEAYKDVIHEDAIKIGTATKAPDYSFRIGGVRKFFVEAKKPSVNVKDDISPAYQLRRYAWSAKLPLSVLTDFEEFAVYDCRVRPLPTDKSSTSRTMYVQYTDYAGKWDEIAGVFSKDAVLKGSFDRYAGTSKGKRGTAEVDDAFLNEIEGWRKTLAANIALRNPDLSQRELNFAVQRTIDRIIFLRICEDRGIETYGSLMALQNGERSYKRLTEMFHRADEKYNSGLFHFRPEKERNEPPDEMTLQLEIDDKPLKDIVKGLYYPNSPYEFSVLPADILGQVYEQFLGKVIRLTPGHRAVVEDKPEVKKAGGVYYTPTYIVEYIVKNTVGRLLGNDLPPHPGQPTDLTSASTIVPADRPSLSKGEGVLGAEPNPLPRFMTTDAHTWKYLKPLAQENRQQPTEAEEKLWQRLRNRQAGFKFRRQHAIGEFVVDFVCIENNLVVEVDGQIHADQQEYDAERSRRLNTRGFRVIRFWNHEVINTIEDVLSRIRQALDLTSASTIVPADRPSLSKGEGVLGAEPNPLPLGEGPGVGSKDQPKPPITPKHVSRLRILDPACGSGSFLIGAYQYLLDWHRDWYVNDGVEKWTKGKNPTIYQGQGGDWRLTTSERKNILLNNIYGVDIDAQAVETTKLSLLLKVLEGENEQTISRQLRMFHERALPDLAANIKCGNSLIGPDFYDGQLSLMNDEERLRINVFDWHAEFPQVFTAMNSPPPRGGARGGVGSTDSAGFDAVIGNPPYIRIQAMKEWAPVEVEFYKERYHSASSGNYDIYVVFVEKGLGLLNKSGLLGFILPHKFFNAQYGAPLRELISKGKHLSHVVHFGDQQVFDGATTYTCLMFLQKAETAKTHVARSSDLLAWKTTGQSIQGVLDTKDLTASEWNLTIGKGAHLLKKLSSFPVKLEDVTSRIFQGIKTSADKIYIVEELGRKGKRIKVFSPEKQTDYWMEPDLLHPLIKGGDSKRYSMSRTNRLLLFPYAKQQKESAQLISENALKTDYPLTWEYLKDNKTYLENREDGKMRGAKWYAYGRNQAIDVMPLPKVFTPDIAACASFSLDETGEAFFTGGVAGGYGILVSENDSRSFVLGLLNSKLLEWMIKQTATQMRGGYYSFESRFIRSLPIRTINFSDPADTSRHDRMVGLVQQMLDLNKSLADAKTAHERTALQRQIEATDKQIDGLVYELYGLTEEERRIVEGSS